MASLTPIDPKAAKELGNRFLDESLETRGITVPDGECEYTSTHRLARGLLARPNIENYDTLQLFSPFKAKIIHNKDTLSTVAQDVLTEALAPDGVWVTDQPEGIRKIFLAQDPHALEEEADLKKIFERLSVQFDNARMGNPVNSNSIMRATVKLCELSQRFHHNEPILQAISQSTGDILNLISAAKIDARFGQDITKTRNAKNEAQFLHAKEQGQGYVEDVVAGNDGVRVSGDEVRRARAFLNSLIERNTLMAGVVDAALGDAKALAAQYDIDVDVTEASEGFDKFIKPPKKKRRKGK